MHLEADRRLAASAHNHHGVFTAEQALGVGLPRWKIDERLKSGEWQTLHPLVYCHSSVPRTWHRDEMAAVYWASPALASGRAAALLYQLPGFEDSPLEILTENRKIVPRAGIVVHVTNRLPSDHRAEIEGIPCTSIERTLQDLCGIVGKRRGAIAVDHALLRGLTTLGRIDFCLYLTARRGRRGCGILREIAQSRAGLTAIPNSPLETVVLDLISRSNLPTPHLQAPIHDEADRFVARPDFVFPDQRVIVEGHSKMWHLGPEAKRRDARRHEGLVALGYEIIYLTWADVIDYPESAIHTIETTLLGRGWKPWAA